VMETPEGPEGSDRGTLCDYTESMYRFHLELADRSLTAKGIIEAFLPQHHAARPEGTAAMEVSIVFEDGIIVVDRIARHGFDLPGHDPNWRAIQW